MPRGRTTRWAMLAGGSLALAGGAIHQSALAAPPEGGTPPAASAALQREEQRPNVLIWMLDDVGFAQLACFGGLIATPNIDRVARTGLRYTRYHTAPVCSAARASFLTGRMPHSVNIGGHTAVARPVPGYNGRIPPSAGTIADNLGQAGYATFALGKWDHVLDEELTPAGPFTQWPTGQGFERFYGFLAADTNNWHPTLVQDQTPIPTPESEHYHLNNDLADRAISMIDGRRTLDPARPFFMYWATGTAHAPHHAPKAWIDRYKGKFDMGWDKAREQILRNQQAAGLMPSHARLAPRPDGMQPWNGLSSQQKKLYTRQMEVFAAALSHADEQFGRILDALETRGELDNTIVIVTSDNGASAEGSTNGMFSEALLGRGRRATLEENMAFYDRWGGPETFPHYSFGWAVAGNTPFRYFKHATHEGGTHVPFVIAWPKGIAGQGELRGQFTHVSDVAATILEATGVPLAERVNNAEQQPLEGVSFAYSFGDAKAPTRKDAQYFEMFGNKGLWSQGWSIVTSHRLEPWDMRTSRPIVEPWELYDLMRDPGQRHDLAAKYPERVAQLDGIFEEQAERYHVNPIGNISDGLVEAMRKAREEFARRGGVWRYSGPISHIRGAAAPPVGALGFAMEAELDLPAGGGNGPLFAAGGQLGGMSLYIDAGRPIFVLNTMEGETSLIEGGDPLGPGPTRMKLEFGNPGDPEGPQVTISANGRELASGRIPAAAMQSYASYELFDIGVDHGSSVMPGVKPGGQFQGIIRSLTFDFARQQ